MLRLLAEVPGPGYPGDYLLARLQGRKGARGHPGGGALAENSVLGGDRVFWEEAARERSWMFRQLEANLRAALAPLFLFFEIGRIARILRYQAVERYADAEQALQGSMLAPPLRAILSGREGTATVLTSLERSEAGELLFLTGLRASFETGGLRSCEELLRRRFLMRALERAWPRDLVSFLQAQIDIRNILAVAKTLRWSGAAAPVFVPGGRVRLPGAGRKATMEDLARMVRGLVHAAVSRERLQPEELEPLLRMHLLRQLARRRREGSVAAGCIEHLWRGHARAREQSMRLHGVGEGEA